MPNHCIFCSIARKQVPAKIVYEDENGLAFLDINPRSKGMCIVIPKKHFSRFDEDFELASKVFDIALIVAEKIKKALNPLTVFFSVMEAQVPHFHVRVYPVYRNQIPLFENKPLRTTEAELDELSRRIKSASVEWKGRKEVIVEKKVEVKKEEKPKEKRSEEDIFWAKRNSLIP